MVSLGSSPLTRGKQAGEADALKLGGLIPAHARKTSSFPWLLRRSAAHPHSRGENGVSSIDAGSSSGSSPLTRGKRKHLLRGRFQRGLIPAHAGKTSVGGGAGCRPRAHPRSRGENVMLMVFAAVCPGSSPLTRGKPLSCAMGDLVRGLIPAHAGKTLTDPSRQDQDPGSSPLTRGKQALRLALGGEGGLIPVHAGKTCLP